MTSPASRLYAVAAHSTFAFLSLSDVAMAARSNRAWLEFASSMPSRRFGIELNSADLSVLGVDSPTASSKASPRSLRHHLAAVNCTAAVQSTELDLFLSFLRSFPQLQRVQVLLADDKMTPALEALKVGEQLRLPSSLLEFRVLIDSVEWFEHRFLQMLVRLAATAPLLHTFAMCNANSHPRAYHEIGFGPLLQLPHLTELVVQIQPSSDQLALLSELRTIRRMRFPQWDDFMEREVIRSFGQQPGQLPHCEWLELRAYSIGAEEIDALAKVAALTRLPTPLIGPDGWARMHVLPQPLRRLDFDLDLDLFDNGD